MLEFFKTKIEKSKTEAFLRWAKFSKEKISPWTYKNFKIKNSLTKDKETGRTI